MYGHWGAKEYGINHILVAGQRTSEAVIDQGAARLIIGNDRPQTPLGAINSGRIGAIASIPHDDSITGDEVHGTAAFPNIVFGEDMGQPSADRFCELFKQCCSWIMDMAMWQGESENGLEMMGELTKALWMRLQEAMAIVYARPRGGSGRGNFLREAVEDRLAGAALRNPGEREAVGAVKTALGTLLHLSMLVSSGLQGLSLAGVPAEAERGAPGRPTP
jgi:hypothetical protein